jgi:hypothetical protein
VSVCLYSVLPGKARWSGRGRCKCKQQPPHSPACLERWCSSSASHLLNCSPHLWQLSPPEPLPAPPSFAVSSQEDARWPLATEPFLSSSTHGDRGGVQRTPPRTEPLHGRPCPAPAHAGPGVPGRSVPTNDDTTPPSPPPPPQASCAAAAPVPTAASPPQPPKPVILSSQRELVLSTTSCAMGLRNSLLPMDRGLQLGGCPGWRLLPWMTSRRLAMEREHPDRAEARLVTIDDRWPPPPATTGPAALLARGTWTSDSSERQCSDRLSANHNVGGGASAALSSSFRAGATPLPPAPPPPPPPREAVLARLLLSPIAPRGWAA